MWKYRHLDVQTLTGVAAERIINDFDFERIINDFDFDFATDLRADFFL